MNKDWNVIILGAGAMGAAYASRFFESNPEGIAFVASGERYERLKANGVIVNGNHFPIPVLSPADASPPADLIMVALKHQHQ